MSSDRSLDACAQSSATEQTEAVRTRFRNQPRSRESRRRASPHARRAEILGVYRPSRQRNPATYRRELCQVHHVHSASRALAEPRRRRAAQSGAHLPESPPCNTPDGRAVRPGGVELIVSKESGACEDFPSRTRVAMSTARRLKERKARNRSDGRENTSARVWSRASGVRREAADAGDLLSVRRLCSSRLGV